MELVNQPWGEELTLHKSSDSILKILTVSAGKIAVRNSTLTCKLYVVSGTGFVSFDTQLNKAQEKSVFEIGSNTRFKIMAKSEMKFVEVSSNGV